MAVNWYAQILANSQADLVNRNLALSDENARLREVITTLHQDNASLKQRLDVYEQRLRTLEQTMVGGAHPDTPFVGVQNTTRGKCPQHYPCGRGPQTPIRRPTCPNRQSLQAQLAHVLACLQPKWAGLRGTRDALSYIPNQSPTPRRKLELSRKELSRKGPTFVPVISPMTKAAPLLKHRKGQMVKQPKS